MQEIRITKQQARRYLIRRHCLTDDTALADDEAVIAYIRGAGCIQFDPLDVVGRNPDLVLQARSGLYRKGDIEKLLYRDRRLFDVWDKNMSICAVEDWPHFSRHRRTMQTRCREFREAIAAITLYLRENEYACSSDFELEERVDWHYGPQRLAKAALECMCYAGLAVVHHKKGTRRYYCLAENFIPRHLLKLKDPNSSEEDYAGWLVLRRMNSIGLLWNRGGDAWLGTVAFKSEQRNAGFSKLLREGSITALRVEGIDHPVYIDSGKLSALQSSIDVPVPDDNVRILAPLDNMLWDRKLLAELFGFEYKWEVYVPLPQRKYGYYVLPVLRGDRFVGRTELRVDKQRRTLIVQSFWREKGVRSSGKLTRDFKRCLQRFMEYLGCVDVACDIDL